MREEAQATSEALEQKARLLGSFMTYSRTFFELRTGKKFRLSSPKGRECRHKIFKRELKKVFRGETKRLIIIAPPRYGKTENIIDFVGFGIANNPQSNWIYCSYSQEVASRQTHLIRDLISLPHHQQTFGVKLDASSTAKHNFRTMAGGEVYGVGAGGSITSRGAGIAFTDTFGGAIIIDDIHKPKDVFSDTIRKSTNLWFYNTMYSRLNDPKNTPIIVMGQRLHEDDLIGNLMKEKDQEGNPVWTLVNLAALDAAGNALDEEKHTVDMLKEMEYREPYTYWSQMQGSPRPLGGGLFRGDDFNLTDHDPEMMATFITIDTAETDKTWNDATAMSFWGVYRIKYRGIDSGLLGLHWLDCREVRIEPRDLENEFFDFYADCLKHSVKPAVVIIEKKSTGVTLCSILKGTPGIRIRELNRSVADGSKISRFIDCQNFVASHQVSIPRLGKHTEKCLDHMKQITGNNTHYHDDIADTMQMAIQCALIDNVICPIEADYAKQVLDEMNAHNRYMDSIRSY